jgi:hypothetical protein
MGSSTELQIDYFDLENHDKPMSIERFRADDV